MILFTDIRALTWQTIPTPANNVSVNGWPDKLLPNLMMYEGENLLYIRTVHTDARFPWKHRKIGLNCHRNALSGV